MCNVLSANMYSRATPNVQRPCIHIPSCTLKDTNASWSVSRSRTITADKPSTSSPQASCRTPVWMRLSPSQVRTRCLQSFRRMVCVTKDISVAITWRSLAGIWPANSKKEHSSPFLSANGCRMCSIHPQASNSVEPISSNNNHLHNTLCPASSCGCKLAKLTAQCAASWCECTPAAPPCPAFALAQLS